MSGYIKLFLLITVMTVGFWFIYALIWYTCGLSLSDSAMWFLMALAGLTEYGYIQWVKG